MEEGLDKKSLQLKATNWGFGGGWGPGGGWGIGGGCSGWNCNNWQRGFPNYNNWGWNNWGYCSPWGSYGCGGGCNWNCGRYW